MSTVGRLSGLALALVVLPLSACREPRATVDDTIVDYAGAVQTQDYDRLFCLSAGAAGASAPATNAPLGSVSRRVVVPVAAPGLVAVAILNFIGGWNEFLFALILTSRDIQTTPVAAAGFSTNKGILWGEMAAVGVTASIPVIVFALIVQKRLVRGLTLGAVQ